MVERGARVRRLRHTAPRNRRQLAHSRARGSAPAARGTGEGSMADLIRVLPKREVRGLDTDPHLREEWLVTNGLGGYASGTVTGVITRRYHGLLIAALPNPLGRMMMLNGLSERLRLPDRRVVYTGAEELAGITPENTLAVAQFRLEAGLPVWRYDI